MVSCSWMKRRRARSSTSGMSERHHRLGSDTHLYSSSSSPAKGSTDFQPAPSAFSVFAVIANFGSGALVVSRSVSVRRPRAGDDGPTGPPPAAGMKMSGGWPASTVARSSGTKPLRHACGVASFGRLGREGPAPEDDWREAAAAAEAEAEEEAPPWPRPPPDEWPPPPPRAPLPVGPRGICWPSSSKMKARLRERSTRKRMRSDGRVRLPSVGVLCVCTLSDAPAPPPEASLTDTLSCGAAEDEASPFAPGRFLWESLEAEPPPIEERIRENVAARAGSKEKRAASELQQRGRSSRRGGNS